MEQFHGQQPMQCIASNLAARKRGYTFPRNCIVLYITIFGTHSTLIKFHRTIPLECVTPFYTGPRLSCTWARRHLPYLNILLCNPFIQGLYDHVIKSLMEQDGQQWAGWDKIFCFAQDHQVLNGPQLACNATKCLFVTLKSPFRGYLLVGCTHSFISFINILIDS